MREVECDIARQIFLEDSASLLFGWRRVGLVVEPARSGVSWVVLGVSLNSLLGTHLLNRNEGYVLVCRKGEE